MLSPRYLLGAAGTGRQDMDGFAQAIGDAVALILSGDAALWAIVGLSLQVSLAAVVIASVVAMPFGAALAVLRFPGRQAAIVVLNAAMGLPPVVIGLLVYLLLSRSGPLGAAGLLYSPTAMIIAQTILIAPIVAALTRAGVEGVAAEYDEQLRSFGIRRIAAVPTLLWEARQTLATAFLAGFGRAIAEVGAVIIVGGNINHVTRVMTTTIALETSKGNLEPALALGVILVSIALTVNAAVGLVSHRARALGHA